jgi:cytochrome c-type biogenesis protein CcmH/NrfG
LLNLGNTRLAQRQFGEALASFRRLIELDPNSLDALHRVAWMLATQEDAQQRNGAEAVRLARHACELTANQNPASLNVLAAAYAEVGQFDQAVAQAEKAEQLARATGQTGLADIIQKLIDLYRQGQPYREVSP